MRTESRPYRVIIMKDEHINPMTGETVNAEQVLFDGTVLGCKDSEMAAVAIAAVEMCQQMEWTVEDLKKIRPLLRFHVSGVVTTC